MEPSGDEVRTAEEFTIVALDYLVAPQATMGELLNGRMAVEQGYLKTLPINEWRLQEAARVTGATEDHITQLIRWKRWLEDDAAKQNAETKVVHSTNTNARSDLSASALSMGMGCRDEGATISLLHQVSATEQSLGPVEPSQLKVDQRRAYGVWQDMKKRDPALLTADDLQVSWMAHLASGFSNPAMPRRVFHLLPCATSLSLPQTILKIRPS